MPHSTRNALNSYSTIFLLTHDLDFSAILAATHGKKPSAVKIRAEDLSPDGIGEQIVIADN